MIGAHLASLSGVVALQAALVGLPKPEALARLERLRSRAWAAALPGMIIAGTLVVLLLPSTASKLIALAGVMAVPLTLVAVGAVARERRLLLVIAALALALSFAGGAVGEVSASVVTTLGCLTLGVGLARLTPERWLPIGVFAMCATDVGLFAVGAGQSVAGLMAQVGAEVHGPVFDQVRIGTMTVDYPDLVLAAALGGLAARSGVQGRAVVIMTVLATASGMVVLVVHLLPATVSIAMCYLLLRWGRVPRAVRRPAAAGNY